MKIGKLYWFFTLLIFLLVSSDAGFDYPLNIFYIPGAKYLYHIAVVSIVSILHVLTKRVLTIDTMTVFLFVRIFINLLSSYIVNRLNFSSNWYFWLCIDIAFICYLITNNMSLKLKNVSEYFLLFALALSVQTAAVYAIYTAQGVVMNDITAKILMRVPFAPSNLIAGAISPAILVLLFYKDNKNIWTYVQIFVHILALYCIRSRGAIILLALLFLYYLVKYIRSNYNQILRLFLYLIILVAVFSFSYRFLGNEEFLAYFSGYKGYGSLNNFSSGRVDVFEYSWNQFLSHPIMGRGIYFDVSQFVGSTGSHNIILETMMNSGIVGLFIHVFIYGIVFHRIYNAMKKNYGIEYKIIGLILVSFYITSLFEASYYNYINDVLFWSLFGFLSGQMRHKT